MDGGQTICAIFAEEERADGSLWTCTGSVITIVKEGPRTKDSADARGKVVEAWG